ncbi:MAG: hypothetical protein Q8P51_14410 [Ignavibacteria bacterium]|nr:hypothetical protein [Ignavibacteria bacterium]
MKLDEYLVDFFSRLIADAKAHDLLRLKNKPGVIELWYYVGEGLKFVDDPQIVHPSDRRYIWRALWQHAGDLAPGEMKSRAGTNRDHFLYCYRLARYDKGFVLAAGNWREWQDFFDSPILSNNSVLDWFEKKISVIANLKIKNWLRPFIKLVRNEYQNIDMSFLSDAEISNKLEKAFEVFLSQHASSNTSYHD